MERRSGKTVASVLPVLLSLIMLVTVNVFTAPKAKAATSTWDGTVTTSFSGAGTAASPYIIDSAAKLAGVAQLTNNNTGWSGGKYMVLTVDIDLNNRQWTPIGIQRQNGGGTTYSENNAWFCGYFDGNGHTVKNVRVGTSASSRASVKHVGLFGIVGGSGQIYNLGVETAQYYINHYCDDERVGGFVGYCKGVIQGCYARNVTINQNGVCVIGGFCGQATSESTIYKSYAYNVSLTQGSGRKGGFVGDGDGTVAFSFVNYYPFHSGNGDGRYIYAYGETNVTGDIVGNGTNTGYGPESFMSGGNNGGWPQLIWQSTGPMDYNTTDGYIVDSAAKMRSLACFVNNGRSYSGAKIALKADIDLSAYDWAPIGINHGNRNRYFSGTFNGNGHIVSNMKIGTSGSRNTYYIYKGLFGYTWNAVINCVGINNAQIYGNGPTDYRCGALVGQADGGSGRIYQCFVKNSTVNMTGTGVSGVTVGDLRHNMTDCYTLNSSATGTRAGSVVGDIKSTLYNVYSGANCSSTTNSYTSENKGTPVNCYHKASTSASAGYVSTFNSYANKTNYTQSAGAWMTDVYNINGGYACLKWEPRFSIAFNGNGGSVSASPLTGRYQFTATTPTASRSYYNFNGYYTASSGGTRVIGQSETYSFGTTNPSNSSQTGTLYAQWAPWQHTVAYNANGGSGAPASQTKTFGVQLNLSTTVPTKTGYHFTGWNTQQNGGGTSYAAGANYPPDQNGGTVTLYAQWEINSYNVTFSANGTGYTNTAPASTVTHGGSVSFTVTLSTGYTNSANPSVTATNGTVSASKSGNTITYTVSNITSATTISVGAATKNTYAVTFNKNGTGYTNTTPATSVAHGGSVSFTVTLSEGYTNSANPTVSATNGTVSASKSGNTITYTVSNITAATTISVGAATKNTYAVTFNKNGSGYSNTTPVSTVAHGGSVSFTVTLSEGYTNSANPTVTATNGTVSASKSGNTITYTVSNITAATTINVGAATINSYTVTFKDGYTNETLKTVNVSHGSGAAAPTPADYHAIDGNNEKHMKFTGWDGSFSNVTGALTVTAQYAQEDHDYGALASVDGNDHSRTCADCGYVQTEAHAWEWITDTAATCGAAGVKHQKCSICGAEQNENTPIDATGAHVWKWVTDTEPTCGAAGVKHEECENCDAVQNENTEIPATGAHVWKWVTDTEPTCGVAGVKHEECENCDAVRNENTPIDPTGAHVWKWVTDTEATCGAAGVKHEECENCDAVQSENTPIDPTGAHVWKWVVDTEPTCGAAGVKHEECENCDAVQSENTPIDPTGAHVWKWVTDTEPTCGAAGVKHEECENCDAVQSENTPIDPTGAHVWKWVTDTEPTCGAAGVKHEECENCDAVQSENTPIDPTGAHTAGEAQETVITPATCGAAGSKRVVVKCSVCGTTLSDTTEEIPATGAHVWKWVTDTEPTCGAAGVKHEKCENCDAVRNENTPIDATGAHVWKWVTDTEPTCGAAGVKHEECENCDAVQSENTPIDPTGAHVWKWVTDTEPTCGVAGVKHEECENCDAVRNENTPIDATGAHVWKWVTDTEPTCGAAGVKHEECENCDAVQSENTPIDPTGDHTAGAAEESVITPATCGAAGSKRVVVKCSVCGTTLSDTTAEIPATGEHTPGAAEESVITPATCGAVGSKRVVVKCSVCGTTLSDTTAEIPATGEHTPGAAEESVITPATCGAAGSKRVVVKCSVCGTTLSDTTAEIPATGAHTPGEAEESVITPATCGEAGSKRVVVKCSVCGTTLSDTTEEIPATGEHTPCAAEESVITPATCGAAGSKRVVVKCSVCGTTLSDTTAEIPATGEHTPGAAEESVITPATCGAAGSKRVVVKCSVCGTTLSDTTTEIPATGEHVWKWVTDTEATCGAAGVKHEECENCDATQSAGTVIPATGVHDLVCASNGDGTHAVTCRNCDYSATSDCDYEETFHAATCVKGSYTTYVCKECGYIFDGSEGDDRADHDLVYASNGDGTHAVTCRNCGYTATADCEYEETAHAATCVKGAYTTYVCKDCGYTFDGEPTGEPDASNHAAIITVGAQAATATEDGYTGDKVCSACGETVETGTVIPATGEEPTHPTNPSGGERIHGRFCFCYGISTRTTIGLMIHYLCEIICAVLEFIFGLNIWA